jgi:hypothetical protein
MRTVPAMKEYAAAIALKSLISGFPISLNKKVR